MIDIKGLDRAELLVALHAGTRALGLGVLHDRGAISYEAAKELCGMGGKVPNANGLDGGTSVDMSSVPGVTTLERPKDVVNFDYVQGRPLKVSFRGDELHGEWLYDRDAPGGPGSCERIVAELKKKASAGRAA